MNLYKRVDELTKKMKTDYKIQYGFCVTSLNLIDSIIAVANKHKIPIMLLATRTQIEFEKVGKGYVNDWSTRDLSNYINKHDSGKYVLLCRDHGGLSAEHREVLSGQTYSQALNEAKESLLEDIHRNFNIIHLDVSYDFKEISTIEKRIMLLMKLYEFCCYNLKHDLSFEISVTEQSGSLEDYHIFSSFMEEFSLFCIRKTLPSPLFVTLNAGTLVTGNINTGKICCSETLNEDYAKNMKLLTKCAECYGVFTKVHNADYIPLNTFYFLRDAGVKAVNIGPQMGVAETKYIINICEGFGLKKLRDQFLEHFYTSRKWEKRINSMTSMSDVDKAIISGHYNYSSAEFKEAFSELSMVASCRGLNVRKMIVAYLQSVIERMVI